ncbi:MAG: hypothetical protein PHX83_10575 [Acidobacteriia bacterium]|nr:hypothetical protein [Terriglobia bacterium]
MNTMERVERWVPPKRDTDYGFVCAGVAQPKAAAGVRQGSAAEGCGSSAQSQGI